MTRVLVTGGSGLIGRNTLEPLLAAGFEVHAVARGKPAWPTPAEVAWSHVDLLSPDAANQLIDRVRPTHLLHLAWYAEPGRFWTSPENLRWVEASLRLLRSFADRDGQRAVVAGTCAEYAWERSTRCIEGKTPCRPSTLYGASKHGLRVVAEAYAAQLGVSLAWGRVFFVFGPGEDPARLGGSIAHSLALGEPAKLSQGDQIRDFLHSRDLGDAFVALLRSEVKGPVNLGSGQPMTIRQLAEALAAAAGRPDLLEFGAHPSRPGEPAELIADISRLRDEVGWAASAPFDQRAAETIAWWRAHVMDRHRRPACA